MRQLDAGIHQTRQMAVGINSGKGFSLKQALIPSIDAQQRFLALVLGVGAAIVRKQISILRKKYAQSMKK